MSPAPARFGLAVFLGAFLLFQVQFILAKRLLPWFGGAPAVWTTCMLFFQVALLLGYAYAHGLARAGPRGQRGAHLALLAAALVLHARRGMEARPGREPGAADPRPARGDRRPALPRARRDGAARPVLARADPAL